MPIAHAALRIRPAAGLLGDLHVYDSVQMSWTDISVPAYGVPPAPRGSHGLAVVNGLLYVFGGFAAQGVPRSWWPAARRRGGASVRGAIALGSGGRTRAVHRTSCAEFAVPVPPKPHKWRCRTGREAAGVAPALPPRFAASMRPAPSRRRAAGVSPARGIKRPAQPTPPDPKGLLSRAAVRVAVPPGSLCARRVVYDCCVNKEYLHTNHVIGSLSLARLCSAVCVGLTTST